MPQRTRPAAASACIAAALALILPLSACASDGWTATRDAPAPLGAVTAGFLPEETPAPESTIPIPDGSWGSLAPAPGYRVVLLWSADASGTEDAGGSAPTRVTVDAVRAWAGTVRAELRVIEADPHDPIPGIVRSMELNGDLIVVAGDALIDPLAVVSANHLDREFLVLGAELAEPTGNVTAVDWTGASFRGEGLGTASGYDPASFTAERCGNAIRAGAAAVLSGRTGVVLTIG